MVATDSIAEELVGLHKPGSIGRVKKADLFLRQRKKIIRSVMFLKEKYLPNDEFDKLKALHAFASREPVSCIHGCGISAREQRVIATADANVGMAFLKAKLNREIIMTTSRFFSCAFLKTNPSFLFASRSTSDRNPLRSSYQSLEDSTSP